MIDHHLLYCTHCRRAPWKVTADCTTTSAQLRHIRKYHARLPSTHDQEEAKLRVLEAATSNTTTPFALAATQAATQAAREVVAQFDNQVNILNILYL